MTPTPPSPQELDSERAARVNAETVVPEYAPSDTDEPSSSQSGTPHKNHADTLQTQFGRFVLKSRLGQGAFGVVYRAHDPQLDREVALKISQAVVPMLTRVSINVINVLLQTSGNVANASATNPFNYVLQGAITVAVRGQGQSINIPIDGTVNNRNIQVTQYPRNTTGLPPRGGLGVATCLPSGDVEADFLLGENFVSTNLFLFSI